MWMLTDGIAQVDSLGLRARLDLAHPERGLTDVQVACSGGPRRAVPIPHLLEVQLAGPADSPPPVIDHYVRGPDLVLTYAAAAAGDVQSQVYWRVLSSAQADACGLETIVSVQTDRLNSDPASGTSTHISAEEIWTLGSDDVLERCDLGEASSRGRAIAGNRGLFLFRLPACELSYLEMVHPSDLTEARVVLVDAAAHVARSFLRLFAERLEKGVIRRGRVRGLFLPRAGDTAIAPALYREFVESTPPLTV